MPVLRTLHSFVGGGSPPSRQKQVYNRRTVRTVLSPTMTTTGGQSRPCQLGCYDYYSFPAFVATICRINVYSAQIIFCQRLCEQFAILCIPISTLSQISFPYKDLGVTQSLHGNVYKVLNFEGQVTDVCHALQVELA